MKNKHDVVLVSDVAKNTIEPFTPWGSLQKGVPPFLVYSKCKCNLKIRLMDNQTIDIIVDSLVFCIVWMCGTCKVASLCVAFVCLVPNNRYYCRLRL